MNLRAQWLAPDTAILIQTDRYGREWYSVVTSRHDVKISVMVPDLSDSVLPVVAAYDLR